MLPNARVRASFALALASFVFDVSSARAQEATATRDDAYDCGTQPNGEVRVRTAPVIGIDWVDRAVTRYVVACPNGTVRVLELSGVVAPRLVVIPYDRRALEEILATERPIALIDRRLRDRRPSDATVGLNTRTGVTRVRGRLLAERAPRFYRWLFEHVRRGG